MYNHQLDTFMLVAEEGSFSGAAQKLYISSSAVNQQITNLEDNLGVQLFFRSRQGLTLTEAGKYLMKEIPTLINHTTSIRSKLSEINELNNETIVVAIPHMHEIRLFYEYWSKYHMSNHGIVQLISPNSWVKSETFQTYSDSDIVEYIDINSTWQKGRSFLKLEDVKVCCGVPKTHPLAHKELITLDDLKGVEVVTAEGAFSNTIRSSLNLLIDKGVKLTFVEQYTAVLMDDCYLNNTIILLLKTGNPVHNGFTTIPIDWDCTVPYGFSIKNTNNLALDRFLNFVRSQLNLN